MTDRLRMVRGVEAVSAGLRAALAGADPVAPLSDDPVERAAAEQMLQPGIEVAERDAAVVLSTSGSSGAPKGVVLSRVAITAAVAAVHERLGGPGDWVLVVPPHYVAGLMVIARTVVAGTRLRALTRSEVLPEPDGQTYTAMVPTQLRRALAETGNRERLAGYAAVLLGGAAADPALLAEAEAAGVRVVSTYGMTETCGGCVYDGIPLAGVDVRVEAGGRLSIGGPMIFSGYRLRPDLTEEVLAGGRLITSDRGRFADDRLHVDGRVDDVVISGGLNVDLAAVERLARERFASELTVVAVPDPEWGSVVVVATEGPETLDDVRSALADRLPAYARPRRLVSMARLPRTSSGKIDRQRLIRDLERGDR